MANNIKYITLLTLFLAINLPSFSQTSFYVSPNGKDTNSGTLKKPFKTIERAKNEVSKLNGNMTENITVFLRGGMYQLDAPVVFTEKDGGNNDFSVSYKAYENETPIISGGKVITGWEEHENGIWKAPANAMEFRQLYVNGKRGTRSRYPNADDDYLKIKIWDFAKKEMLITNNDVEGIEQWGNFDAIEMMVQMVWTGQVFRLKSFDASSATSFLGGSTSYVKLSIQERENLVFARDWPPKLPDQPFHFENAYEFIDTPGEWYLDKKADMLYYMPEAGTDMSTAEVIAPSLEKLIEIKGKLEDKVEGLTFEGLAFQHSNFISPSKQGFLPTQAGQESRSPTVGNEQYVTRPMACIDVAYAENIQFNNNEFTKIGNPFVLDMHEGVTNSLIKGNAFHNISGSSMMLAKFSDGEIHLPYDTKKALELCENITVSNNYITKIGLDYPGSVGITVGYGKNITIEHNEISYTPYSGISVGWGWVHQDNVMENNIIQYNLVHHVVQKLGDGGGIYTLSKQPGTKIYRNYLHDIVASEWSVWGCQGIYLDEGSGGSEEKPMIVKENVVTAGDKRFKMHRAGNVMFNHNFNYTKDGLNEIEERVTVRALVVEKAGLQPAYKHLKELANK